MLDMVEDVMSQTRASFEQQMCLASSKSAATQLIRAFEVQLIRLCLGKAPAVTFLAGVATGKMSEEKVKKVKDMWARHVQGTLSHFKVSEATGYEFLVVDGDGPGTADLDEDRICIER